MSPYPEMDIWLKRSGKSDCWGNSAMLVLPIFSAAFSLLGFVQAVVDNDGPVMKLTSQNFDQFVGGDRPALVKFFAPWCGHCKTLAPVYQKIAVGFPTSKLVIAEVNTDENKDLAKRFGIKGLPTLFWYPANVDVTKPEKYEGKRDLETITKFLSTKTGLRGNVKAVDGVTELNASNFKSITQDTNKGVLVDFYAPWCGHCKKLAPIYEQLSEIFRNEPDCLITKLDGDKAKTVVKSEGIKGYPTIKFYGKGGARPIEVNERDLKGLVAQMNRLCGTKRTVDGHLSKSAGLLAEMEPIVKQFAKDPTNVSPALAQFTQEKSSQPNASIIPYALYMEKIQKFGKDFIPKELARLTNLINADSVDAKKADEFAIRRNILAVFAEASDIPVPDFNNADLIAEEVEAQAEQSEGDNISEEVL